MLEVLSVDGLDGLAEGLDVELLVGDGGGVGEVVAVGEVGVLVVLRGLVEERACDEDKELVCGEELVVVVFELFGREVFGDFLEVLFRDATVWVEVFAYLREVDPSGDGGFECGDVFTLFISVVAEVGVAGFDEDDGAEANLAEDGGEEDAGIDAVGLTGGEHFVEEAYVLYVGTRGGVGGAGDGGVGDAAVEGVVPDGEGLLGDILGAVGLVAGESVDDALVEDVGEDLLDVGVLLVDVGGEEEACVDDLAAEFLWEAEGEGAFIDGADVEVEVFDVDLFVVDEAGECEVEWTVLPEEAQLVIFPFDGGMEGVYLPTGGEYFLEYGDVVEGGGVDDNTENGVVGGSGEGEIEGGVGVSGGEEERGVELVVEEGGEGGGEVDLAWVKLFLGGIATGGEEEEEEDP